MTATNGDDAEPTSGIDRLARRLFLRRTAGVVGGGLGVTALSEPADAHGDHVTLDVKSKINLESGGVIPAVVDVAKGDAPCFLPEADNVVEGPRFGPSRLFECDGDQDDGDQIIISQQEDEDLCALEQAIANDDGATPVHGDGHRQDDTSVVFHFRTQDADFGPEDIDEDGTVAVTLSYAVEENGVVEAVAPSCLVEGVAPMF